MGKFTQRKSIVYHPPIGGSWDVSVFHRGKDRVYRFFDKMTEPGTQDALKKIWGANTKCATFDGYLFCRI